MAELAPDVLNQAVAALQAAAAGQGPLLGVLFVAGAAGGVSHCLGMCGPFVLAQVSAGLERVPAEAMGRLTRLRGAALLPYHLGRLTTYTALGALAAGLTGRIVSLTGFRWGAAALLAAAAAVFLMQGLSRGARLVPAVAGNPGGGGGRLADALARLAGPLFPDGGGGGGLKGYALGVVLGFLPCGLVYGALAAAASAGTAAAGALAMAAFSLGTVPGLIGLGLVGHLVMGRGRRVVPTVAAGLMVVNSAVLGYLAWRMVA